VTSLTFIAACALAIGANDSDSYSDAHAVTMKTGRPMLIMVGTDWCGPCQMMKKSILPQVRQHGLLRRVAFAIVNADHDQELAEQITGGGPVPQLVMYRKTPKGWLQRKLIGSQSVEAVETFINEGVAKDSSEKPAKGAKPAAPGDKKAAPEMAKRQTAQS
jgi:thioredoxin-like negative regulator of GroEL